MLTIAVRLNFLPRAQLHRLLLSVQLLKPLLPVQLLQPQPPLQIPPLQQPEIRTPQQPQHLRSKRIVTKFAWGQTLALKESVVILFIATVRVTGASKCTAWRMEHSGVLTTMIAFLIVIKNVVNVRTRQREQ